MSEFHRIITYLYLYEDNHKTRNVGFAKIEKRDAQCRIEIHMKNTGYNLSNLPVYFYTQKDTHFPGIPIGSINLVRGTGDFTGIFNAENLADTGYALSCIKGIFVPLSEQHMLLSQWDDDEFERTLFVTAPAQINPPLLTEEPIVLKAAEAAPVLSEEPPSSENEFSEEEVAHQNLKWDYIMKNLPSMRPFPEEDSFEWVKIELKDLRLLPKSYWSLGNNSFLLHGFFNYQHLILGRKRDDPSYQFKLGIPGVFQNPEGVMAAIFGFPEFQSASDNDANTKEFGYWLRSLE